MRSIIRYNEPRIYSSFELAYHEELVSDTKRVTPFKKAITKACKGKRVLESGTGSGIFSIFAAKTGAKKLYATEIDKTMIEFSKKSFKKSNVDVKLIPKDTMKLTIKDLDNKKVDVIIAENLSTWQVTEPQIPIMNHVNKKLIRNNGIRLPERLFNYLELCETKYKFSHLLAFRSYYYQFKGIKKPKILSKELLFSELDLAKINKMDVNKTIKVKANKNGTLNSLRLTSRMKVHENINFYSTDSLFPPIILPLKKELKIKKREEIKLNIKYRYNTDLKKINVTIKNT